MEFTEIINESVRGKHRNGASIEEISKAEEELGVRFNKEYKKYLATFRTAAVDGHEFTGLSERLNVIEITKEERNNNPNIPNRYYVVEKLNIDGAIVWQSQSGRIYISVPNGEAERCADSLYEYLLADIDWGE